MLVNIRRFLGTEVDNSTLVFFRMCYGFLVACESFGAIATGWVQRVLIEPSFTFNFIGLDWLQPLPGNGMYIYFAIMGVCGLMMMLGLFYRYASFLFFVMWSGVYLMQKTSYNNHYYLLMLLSVAMTMMPANKAWSLDVKFGFTKPDNFCSQACIWFFILQIGIVYIIASLNKIHMDWLMARPIGIWFSYKANYWLIGPLLQQRWLHYAIAWGGVAYDGLIVFLLLYKPTRKLGFGLSLFFNLFNSAVFQIGIFPYLMIAFTVFFFPPETIRRIFFKGKEPVTPVVKPLSPLWSWLFIGYFAIHVLLPARHHLYTGNVHWTEEAHKLSWQMMLRAKSGHMTFVVEDKSTGEQQEVDLREYVTNKQRASLCCDPDLIWQFAQRLKQEYAKQGKEIAVYADGKVSLNGHPEQSLVDPSVDLASVSWERWNHSNWILTYDTYD